MNENSKPSAGTAAKKISVLDVNVQALHSQNNAIDRIWGEAGVVLSRLRTIGNMLNSVDHPDNSEPNHPVTDDLKTGLKRNTDGIIGQLDGAIDRKEGLIRQWDNEILPSIQRQLNYIEQYI